MSFDVRISPRALSGRIDAVASKSAVHRALICAALADDATLIRVSGTNADIEATASCLRALGARIDADENIIRVSPLRSSNGKTKLECGESGSTLRFIAPLIPALKLELEMTGAGRLPSRPINELLDELVRHGARVSSASLPFTIGGKLAPGRYAMRGDVSSQYITGLMFALPLLDGDSTIELTTPLQSASYIDMTISMMRRFCVAVEKIESGWRVAGRQKYISPRELTCEGDWSSAAFFLAAGTLTRDGSSVTVAGLDADSPQGDRAIVEILRKFGAKVDVRGDEVSVHPRELVGITIDAGGIPDLVPILSVVGACAKGETRIVNAARLRLKESDRLAAMARTLASLGAQCEERDDSLVVRASNMRGGVVDGCGDHRIVMSAAIAAMRCDGDTRIVGADACEKSYPTFFDDCKRIGGDIDVL